MIEVQLLYDPVTKRCCKKRVTNTLNQMGAEWGSFLLSILRTLTARLDALDSQVSTILTHCQQPVYEALDACDKRMESIHRIVQDQIIQAYVPLANQAEEILSREYTSTQESTSTPTMAKEDTPTPTQVPAEAPTSSSEYVPSKVELPSTSKTAGKVPCLEIDLCDGLYQRLKGFTDFVQSITPLISIVIANMAGQPTPDKPDEPKPKDYAAPYGAFYEPIPDLADVDPEESGEE